MGSFGNTFKFLKNILTALKILGIQVWSTNISQWILCTSAHTFEKNILFKSMPLPPALRHQVFSGCPLLAFTGTIQSGLFISMVRSEPQLS